jgi:hypothetical protein
MQTQQQATLNPKPSESQDAMLHRPRSYLNRCSHSAQTQKPIAFNQWPVTILSCLSVCMSVYLGSVRCPLASM